MASVQARNYTIGTITAFLFVGIALFFDAIKIFLFLVDAIPFIGPAVGFVGSWIDSAIEFICVTVGLYFAGAYKGRNAISSGIITMGLGMIDLIPLLNDFPSTTIAVMVIIARSRANDKIEQLENTKKNIALAKRKKAQYEAERAAQRAAQNANRDRQQAMATSIAVAQS